MTTAGTQMATVAKIVDRPSMRGSAWSSCATAVVVVWPVRGHAFHQQVRARSAIRPFDEFVTEFFSPTALCRSAESTVRRLGRCVRITHSRRTGLLVGIRRTDFREDLQRVTVPSFVIAGGSHGINISHVDEFNDALVAFLDEDFAGVHNADSAMATVR